MTLRALKLKTQSLLFVTLFPVLVIVEEAQGSDKPTDSPAASESYESPATDEPTELLTNKEPSGSGEPPSFEIFPTWFPI